MSDTSRKTGKPNIGSDPTKGPRAIWWQRGLYLLGTALIVALVAANLTIFLRGQFSRILLFAALLVTGLIVLMFKSVRGGFVEPAGVTVGTSEPALTAFVNDIAAQVGCPAPDEIYLVPDVSVRIVEDAQYFGLKTTKSVLVIGMPFLHALTKQELAATIAHHFAHHVDLGVDQGPHALRALTFAQRLIAVERESVVGGVFGSYARKMFRSFGGAVVHQELEADRLAAEIYGTEASLSGVDKVDNIISAYNQLVRLYVAPALEQKMHPTDMYAGFGEVFRSATRSDERAEDVVRVSQIERTEFYLHRGAVERHDVIADLPATAAKVSVGEELAIELLDASGSTSEKVVSTWAAKVTGESTEPQTWSALADQVYSTGYYDTAALAFDDDVMVKDWMGQAAQWSQDGDWSTAQEALEQGLPDVDESARLSTWAKSVVMAAAVEHDHGTWEHSFDGPPEVATAEGTHLDAAAIAADLLGGDPSSARALAS